MLVMVVMLTTAGVIGLFGIGDLSEALTFNGRVTGAFLLVGSLVILVGVAAAVDRWFRNAYQYSALVALIGAGAAALAGLMLLTMAIRDGDENRYLLYWSILAGGSIAACVVIYAKGMGRLPPPKKVGAVVAASSVVAIANFAYSQLYQPYMWPVSVELDAAFGRPMYVKSANIISVPVEITFINHSKVGLYVLYSEYLVMGKEEVIDGAVGVRDVRSVAPKEITPLYARNVRNVVVEKGHFNSYYDERSSAFWSTFSAGGILRKTVIVDLPAAVPYNDVRVDASLVIVRQDRMTLSRPVPDIYSWKDPKNPIFARCRPLDCVVHRVRIHENNSIAEETRDPRYVTIWQYVTGATPPDVAITRWGEQTSKRAGRDVRIGESRYGLQTRVTAGREMSLADVVQRARRR